MKKAVYDYTRIDKITGEKITITVKAYDRFHAIRKIENKLYKFLKQ